MVLSILAENANGLNAYALIKTFREKFTPVATPSPGTIYPLLEKLTKNGDITKDTQDPPIYRLTSEGRQRLAKSLPDILNDSLESMPNILHALIRSLPLNTRFQFMSEFPQSFCGCKSCHLSEEDIDEFDNIQASPTVLIDRLNKLKKTLDNSKQRIEEWAKTEILTLDGQIQKIKEKIEKIEKDRTKWVKIPIESDDK